MSNKLDLINKIKALAARGIGGEKSNAEALIKKLMKKYNLTESDFDETQIWEFKIKKAPYSKQLLLQIIYSVVESTDELYINRNRKSSIYCKCSNIQKVEIEVKYDFYSKHLGDDLQLFYKAFIYKNKILPPNVSENLEDLPQEKIDEFFKIKNMQSGLPEHNFNKQLTFTK